MSREKPQFNEDYWKFAESERHFNETQAGIRNLASGWMLAAFAAIAFLLKTEESVTWLVSPAVLVGVVSFMATMGLLVLWINDQLVYQRLLDCSFISALKMEYDNPQLPPIRTMMMYSAEGKGMSRWMTYFYTIPMWVFLLITLAATLLRESIEGTSKGSDTAQSLVLLIAICIAQMCASIWVQRKKSKVGAKARASLFGVDSFTAMFGGTDDARARLAEVIKRHRPAVAAEGGEVK
jgi:hypothetical protein